MKATLQLTTIAMTAALGFAVSPGTAQAGDVEDFIKRLKGNAKSEIKTRLSGSPSSSSRDRHRELDRHDRGHDRDHDRDRGNYSPRPGGVVVSPGRDRGHDSHRDNYVSNGRNSGSPSVRPSNSGNRRSLSFSSSASVPTSLRTAASQNKVELRHSHGGGAQISYCVDCSSKISRDDILFRKGSTEFADRYSYEIVRDLAYAMKSPELRGMQFVIEGHASAEGSYSSNQYLSQRRAERIVSEMVRLGVDPWQLVAVGYGESEARHSAYSPEYLLAEDRKVVVYRLD